MGGKSRSSASASAKSEASTSEPWVDPDDGPEWTEEMWQRAEIREGDRIIRPGRPPLDELLKKSTVTIRLDPDVVASYKALGTGWQTKINDDLRKARKLGPKRKTA
ncbi:BrnA antitoxin family protein [Tardiphaga sp.]|jgi:uncharacterized protein (DUF4415 family)|uniref:BrnA antitoxin family protein n=1 Tax=Tardiphaga sp. TaxID=1926292 RepID=UPI0037DA4394